MAAAHLLLPACSVVVCVSSIISVVRPGVQTCIPHSTKCLNGSAYMSVPVFISSCSALLSPFTCIIDRMPLSLLQELLAEPQPTSSPAGHGSVPGTVMLTLASALPTIAFMDETMELTVADPMELRRLSDTAMNMYSTVGGTLQSLHPLPLDDQNMTTRQLLDLLRPKVPVALLDQLQVLGQRVGALLPLPLCCNNPACTHGVLLPSQGGVPCSIEDPKLQRCKACRAAFYDCAECQRQHWPQHKAVCKRLAAEGPEAAAACRNRA